MVAGFEAGRFESSRTSSRKDRGSQARRISRLFGFDRQGKVEWDLPVRTEEGAYLFAYSSELKPSERKIVMVATDEAVVKAFEVSRKD